MTLGQGDLTYELAEGWERLPAGWSHGDVVSVAVDPGDRVYVFNRSAHPVIVYDRAGRFLDSWGEGVFTRPHGITITAAGDVWCADDKDHTVRRFTLDGRLQQTLGTVNQPSDSGYVDAAGEGALLTIARGAAPFNRPTRLFQGPSGDLYVADGYGNARVHRFSPAGELLQSWGQPGAGPGQFNLPHSVWVDAGGRVFVCDRENDRIQIFDPSGTLLEVWTDAVRPADLVIRDGLVYVGELATEAGETSMAGRPVTATRPSQVTVRDLAGNVRSRIGEDDPFAPAGIASAHGIAVDSRGDIYVAEVAQTALGRTGRFRPGYPALKKFVRRR